MTWPSSDVNNTNVDASGDDPDLARVDLKDLIDKFNQLRNHVAQTFMRTFLGAATEADARAAINLSHPVFSAYLTGTQSVNSSTTPTKISLNGEEFDSDSTFDSTTNYRHTPTVAGYYQYTGRVHFVSAASGLCGSSLYKNNAAFKLGQYVPLNSGSSMGCVVSALIYMNGSSDYVDLRGFQTSGGAINVGASNAFNTYLQGVLVRPD